MTHRFTIFNLQNGEVSGYVSSNNEGIPESPNPNFTVIPGEYFPHTHYYCTDTNSVQGYSESQAQAKQAMPQIPSTWSNKTLGWVPGIEYLRGLKAMEARDKRDSKEFGPFTYAGMVFDGDADAQRRLAGVVSAAKSALASGHSFTKEFTLADNSVVTLTAEDFIGIEMAKLLQVDVAFQEYRLKKAAIEAVTTLEELEAITI